MALNAEIIKADTTLADLSDPQIEAISTLSKNEEVVAVNAATKSIMSKMSEGLSTASGVPINEGEEPNAYGVRVVSEMKVALDNSKGLSAAVTSLKGKIAGYEKQIAEGSTDDALKLRLSDTENKLKVAIDQVGVFKKTEEKLKATHLSDLNSTKFDNIKIATTNKLDFKKEFVSISDRLINDAERKVLASSSFDFAEVGGKETLVFRGADGEILLDPANGLNPITFDKLIRTELGEVLGASKKKAGAGSGEPGPGDNSEYVIDMAGATTQVMADEKIKTYLMQKGLVRGSSEFAEQQAKIRKDNKVLELPAQ